MCSQRALAALGAGGSVVAAFSYLVISQHQDERISTLMKDGTPPTAEQTRARERSARIDDLLGDLKNKTPRQKLEDAFNGAVQTHSIGFPDGKEARRSNSTSDP